MPFVALDMVSGTRLDRSEQFVSWGFDDVSRWDTR